MMVGPTALNAEERVEFAEIYDRPFGPTKDGSYLRENWDHLAHLGADLSLDIHHREIIDWLRAYTGRYDLYCAMWKQDWLGLYQEVKCPILLMISDDDLLLGFYKRACELRPDAATAKLDGANFELDMDTENAAKVIGDFLKNM